MKMKQLFHKLKDILITLGLMILSTILAFFLFLLVPNNSANICLIYILALIITARSTNGYWYGIFFALFSVICINFFFTYPYFKLNFTLTGYPLSFIVLLTIAIITSAATSLSKKQAKMLAEREEMLNKAEKEKMRANLLRAISHDLRTPLTSIIGETDSYFEMNDKPEEQDELIHRINDDANWLLNMVENLLSVTRIQEDKEVATVNKSLEVVEEIVSEAVTRFKKRQPNALVDIKIPQDYIMLPMDPLLIEQVIVNLLDNAYIHSGSNRAIQLSITDDNDMVSFHIRDFGKGIRPDLIKNIFNGTVTHEVSDSHRGMGIGLSICKTIIEAHSGTIQANNLEEGAEFVFSLKKEETGGQ